MNWFRMNYILVELILVLLILGCTTSGWSNSGFTISWLILFWFYCFWLNYFPVLLLLVDLFLVDQKLCATIDSTDIPTDIQFKYWLDREYVNIKWWRHQLDSSCSYLLFIIFINKYLLPHQSIQAENMGVSVLKLSDQPEGHLSLTFYFFF